MSRGRQPSELTGREACPRCKEQGGDWNNDNLALYSDGHGFCFACNFYQHPQGGDAAISENPNPSNKKASPLVPEGDYKALHARGITEETCRKFGYTVGLYNGTSAQIAPYYDRRGALVAQHIRMQGKEFRWTGDMNEVQLYGQPLWSGGGRRVVVTEGEIDCLTISQLQGNRWPVVSIPSGANHASKAIRANLEFLESFEEVVLAFDMDEPGRKAAQECAALFTPGKCRIAALPRKDANDCLKDGLSKELLNCLWEAKPYRPDGIINGKDLYEKCKTPATAGLPTPFPALNDKTLGIRPKELWLFTAGSGIGKSTIVNEIAYHQHQTHNCALGVLALEESPDRNGRRYLGIHTDRPLHLPGRDLTPEAYDAAYNATIGRGDWWIYEHFGSSDVDALCAKIRFLIVACEVRVVVLDHISIIVSGLDEVGESERKTIDRLMTKLRQLIEETGATILAVVHLKRPEKGKSWNEGRAVSLTDLRGSGSLEQISDIVVALERDQQGDNPNKARIRVLKNRPTGFCGLAGAVEYHPETGRLLPAEDDDGEGPCPFTSTETNKDSDY